jgi:tRNA pseudouridine55 synthase
VHGLAVVDKPAGMTSHDVVAMCRRELGEKRCGHAGTLDPDATGVLLVGVGAVTRVLRFLTALPKTYTAEVVFGVETSTLDASGEVVATHEMSVSLASARAAAGQLTGNILQVPPMVSALKVDGRRLHELAREGIEVERTPRPVTVHSFDVEPTDDPLVLRVEVCCSSGTYVRTLAADLGHLLGGGAHLRNLCRTRIGSFTVDGACRVGHLLLMTPAEAMRDYPALVVDDEGVRRVAHGRDLPGGNVAAADVGPVAILAPSGELLAVYEPAGGRLRPAVVLATS